MGQLHDMAQNALGLRLGGLVAHELHVQLENIQRHLGEHVQAGIAAAEVVHLDHEPFFPQGRHRVDELLRMLRVGALGDFQMQKGRSDAVFLRQTGERSNQVRLIYVRAGYIHRHRHHRQACGLPVPQQHTDALPDVQIQPGDESVAFKQRDKFAGVHEPPFRVDPPHQRLRAGHAVPPQAVLGLEVHDELVLLQRGLHGGGDRLFPQKAAAHGIVINRVPAIVLSLDAVHRQHRPVAHLLHRQRAVHNGIDAPFGGHVAGHLRVPGVVGSEEPRPVPLLLLTLLQAEKPVGAVPPTEPQRANALPQLSGNLLQQPIAVLRAV